MLADSLGLHLSLSLCVTKLTLRLKNNLKVFYKSRPKATLVFYWPQVSPFPSISISRQQQPKANLKWIVYRPWRLRVLPLVCIESLVSPHPVDPSSFPLHPSVVSLCFPHLYQSISASRVIWMCLANRVDERNWCGTKDLPRWVGIGDGTLVCELQWVAWAPTTWSLSHFALLHRLSKTNTWGTMSHATSGRIVWCYYNLSNHYTSFLHRDISLRLVFKDKPTLCFNAS